VNEICYSKEKLRKRTKIFYCDAGSPTQKSNIHLILIRVYPKGKTPNEMFIEHYSLTL